MVNCIFLSFCGHMVNYRSPWALDRVTLVFLLWNGTSILLTCIAQYDTKKTLEHCSRIYLCAAVTPITMNSRVQESGIHQALSNTDVSNNLLDPRNSNPHKIPLLPLIPLFLALQLSDEGQETCHNKAWTTVTVQC